MEVHIWFDGASKGNPGPMAGGAVLAYEGREEVLHGSPGRGTNNEAEYDGLILGLRRAKALGATRVRIHGDSQLIIKQLQGQYKVKAPNLQDRFKEAKSLLEGFPSRSLQWIPRDENRKADAAANAALNG
ncbi:MAG: ribonuclease HI family protein [Thermoplasmatota archaeon]